jgi:putative hydrolases of HD superfamily
MTGNDLYGEKQMKERAGAVVEMAALALAFGRIDRTGPCHPDGTPESDTDHTVMLGWVAPCLAELINDRMGFQHYDVDRIAAYALVHDAAEVYAGDTPTIRITEEELDAKAVREATATARLHRQFKKTLPWFARMVANYEDQVTKEARFVRAVDKLLPKMVHLVDKRVGLQKQGVTRGEFIALVARQRQQVLDNVSAGNVFVLGLYDILCAQVLGDWIEDDLPSPPQPPAERHWIRIDHVAMMLNHENCAHEAIQMTCPFTTAFEMCKRRDAEWPSEIVDGPLGEYELALDERGLLTVKDN